MHKSDFLQKVKNMLMKEVSSSTLADGVENSILSFIRRKTLQPGDLLPREEEIADDLNVSRLSVREGLGRLKALGLVEPRKRRGTVLRKPRPFHTFSKIARTNMFSNEERRDFMEMRVALELGMSELIYMRKSEKDIAKLRELAMDTDYFYADVNFHSFLMSISGNRNVNEFRQVLAEFFDIPNHPDPERVEKSRQQHIELCDVLENGTAAEFHDAMRKHFQPYFKYFCSEKNQHSSDNNK